MTLQIHTCDSCSQEVLVEKFSEAHTSIQWRGDVGQCPYIGGGGSRPGDTSRRCPALHRSIDRAAEVGDIPVTHVELPTGNDIPRLHREAENP